MAPTRNVMALLAGNGARNTAQRRAVVAAALDRSRPFTAQDLVAELGHVGRATVFRTLDLLVGIGVLSRMHGISEGERCVRYTRCLPEHHHHLRCRACGRVEEVEAPELERKLTSLATRRGYLVLTHGIEIDGLCPRCRR